MFILLRSFHIGRWRYGATVACTSIKSNGLKTFLSRNLICPEHVFLIPELSSVHFYRNVKYNYCCSTALITLSPAHVHSCFEVVCTVAMVTRFPPLITWLTAWLEEGCAWLRRNWDVNVYRYVTFKEMFLGWRQNNVAVTFEKVQQNTTFVNVFVATAYNWQRGWNVKKVPVKTLVMRSKNSY